MALFVVNRYLGENEETDSYKKDVGLENLLRKIEERKNLRLKEQSVKGTSKNFNLQKTEAGISHEENTEVKEKKRKKRRTLSQVELDDSGSVAETETKKIKKRKSEVNDSLTDEVKLENCSLDEIGRSDNALVYPESSDSLSELPKEESPVVKTKKKKKKDKNLGTEQSFNESENEIKDKTKPLKQTDFYEASDDLTQKENPGDLSNSAIENELTKTDSDFMVIGGHDFKQKSTAKWVLPEWLSKPILISGSFKDKAAKIKSIPELDDVIISNLKKNRIKYFFPVQKTIIPWVIRETASSGPGLRFWPRDICVSAPTGSGKTLAFVLPIIQCLKNRFVRRLGALVVVPVQDLAAQVAQVFSKYTVGTGLNVLSVTGQATPFHEEQKRLVRYKTGVGFESLIDIMVTTPGRLVEHIMQTKGFNVQHLKYIVIDEADRVIDNIKNDWLFHLENHMSSGGISAVPPLSIHTLTENPRRPQKLLFSATLTQDPEILKEVHLFQPRVFIYKTTNNDVSTETVNGDVPSDQLVGSIVRPAELEEQWIKCATNLKPLLLYHIIATENWKGVLVFTHFVEAAQRLSRLLFYLGRHNGLNLRVEDISSNKNLTERSTIINDFQAGNIDVLICSDIFARGIDILTVRYVVIYSCPSHARNYVHSVGRTARAGMDGYALTFLADNQVKHFHKMLETTGNSNLTELVITEKEISYLEDSYKKSLFLLKEETIKKKKIIKDKTIQEKRKKFTRAKRGSKKFNLSK